MGNRYGDLTGIYISDKRSINVVPRLIQHTFPLPDGSALRLTIAEYLTPSLRHVTQVGAAQFDQSSGRWVGGGIKPDILCESRYGF